MDLKEIGWKGIKWIHLAQDKYLKWVVTNLFISQETISSSVKIMVYGVCQLCCFWQLPPVIYNMALPQL